MPKNKPLTSAQLAELFIQLSRLESSGLPATQAFSILKPDTAAYKNALAAMEKMLQSGKSIAESGYKVGLFTATHHAVIHAAEASGQLAIVYENLAGHYAQKNSRLKKIKSKLFLPAATLVLSIFVAPLPDLVSGTMTTGVYLKHSVGALAMMASGVYFLLKLNTQPFWCRAQMRIPGISQWLIKRQINDFMFILGIMLEAGMPFSDALTKATAGIKNIELQQHFKKALSLKTSGLSVTEILATIPMMPQRMIAVIETGEQSGKLASGILHFNKLEAEDIALQDDLLAEWLPRIVYSLIACWIAYSLIQGQIDSIAQMDTQINGL